MTDKTYEETDGDKKIIETYEQENIRLVAENKRLMEQISSGETDVKKDNERMRRKIVELENKLSEVGDVVKLREQHDIFVEKAKDLEINLKERIQALVVENETLKADLQAKDNYIKKMGDTLWDTDERQNEIILNLIQDLKNAYKRQSGTVEAFENLIAIVDPECVISKDRGQISFVKNSSKIPVKNQVPVYEQRRLKSYELQELEDLRAEVARLKSQKAATPRNVTQKPVFNAQQTKRMKELQEENENLKKKLEDASKELSVLKKRGSERVGKVKDLQTNLDNLQRQHDDFQRQANFEKQDLERDVKRLSADLMRLKNIEIQRDEIKDQCSDLKEQVKSLEREIAELKKPKTTGDPNSDRVMDMLNKIESDIHIRTRELETSKHHLLDMFEAEKRELDKRNTDLTNENSELRKKLSNLGEQFQQIQLQVSRKCPKRTNFY